MITVTQIYAAKQIDSTHDDPTELLAPLLPCEVPQPVPTSKLAVHRIWPREVITTSRPVCAHHQTRRLRWRRHVTVWNSWTALTPCLNELSVTSTRRLVSSAP